MSDRATGRGPAWLRRWSGGPESPGSNPGVPTVTVLPLLALRRQLARCLYGEYFGGYIWIRRASGQARARRWPAGRHCAAARLPHWAAVRTGDGDRAGIPAAAPLRTGARTRPVGAGRRRRGASTFGGTPAGAPA